MELIYLAPLSVEWSRQRVAERVAHVGHSIHEADIIRRFPRSLRNLVEHYAGAVNETSCFLNSGPLPDIVFPQRGEHRVIVRQHIYDQLVSAAYL